LNDLRGHVVGDEFLKSLGQLIRSSIRATDAAFRYGGDEFVIVLPNCGPGPAEQIGKRLVETVEQLVKPMKLDRPPGLSLGVNALSRHESHVDAITLLDGADCALYAQKAQRRRQTKPAQPTAA
jgi:two-component system cell cycle response regulator